MERSHYGMLTLWNAHPMECSHYGMLCSTFAHIDSCFVNLDHFNLISSILSEHGDVFVETVLEERMVSKCYSRVTNYRTS